MSRGLAQSFDDAGRFLPDDNEAGDQRSGVLLLLELLTGIS